MVTKATADKRVQELEAMQQDSPGSPSAPAYHHHHHHPIPPHPASIPQAVPIAPHTWVPHAAGSDKELFLRAMKSSVGDKWLTDVMPLDGC
ncbi:hypothetical protein PCANC_15188 [Puccinia coronata f. sp. avenae]|uniref:Uncharacterized protein n=1 Tax=Puccinia coronata f. sp. avenae TaxID=200324 RepID=A0A2N5UF97_9BASI|nr:hypothetical protein PCANC_15188 [Puccinia coronata f. sp. avenae]